MDTLLEPLQYGFMLRGLAAAAIVGVVCAVVGSFVVLRGLAFYGGALAHTILPGVALGYILTGGSTDLFGWALLAAGASALLISAVSRSGRVSEDSAIGITFAGMFALGIALISTVRDSTVDLAHFLFGHVLGVSSSDLGLTAGIAAFVLLLVFAFYKELVIIAFDPTLARTLRLPHGALDMLMMLLIALTIVVSLQTVGIALMVAMLVTPAAAARLVTRRLPAMMAVAVLIGVGSGLGGLYGSFFIRVSSGAAIVLVATVVFLAVWAATALGGGRGR
jgi:manganese/iron transport system permease protein